MSTATLKSDLPTDDDKCPICLDSMILPVTYACRHTFCFLCIKAVIEGTYQPTCPLCRADLDPQAHIEIPQSSGPPEQPYYWQYQGRNFGWWNYERHMSDQIEETYRSFLWHQRALELDQESTLELGLEDDLFESISSDEESLSHSSNLNSHQARKFQCELLIGPTTYVIDVEKMIQYDKNYPDNRKRDIRRVAELDTQEAKGTAGITKYYE